MSTNIEREVYLKLLFVSALGYMFFDALITLTFAGYWIIATMPINMLFFTVGLMFVLKIGCIGVIIGSIEGLTEGMIKT